MARSCRPPVIFGAGAPQPPLPPVLAVSGRLVAVGGSRAPVTVIHPGATLAATGRLVSVGRASGGVTNVPPIIRAVSGRLVGLGAMTTAPVSAGPTVRAVVGRVASLAVLSAEVTTFTPGPGGSFMVGQGLMGTNPIG